MTRESGLIVPRVAPTQRVRFVEALASPHWTILDILRAQVPGVELPAPFKVHPVLGDTSSILAELIVASRRAAMSRLLLAMKVGVIRLFIAHHVWSEVPRKIAHISSEGRCDGAEASRIWWEHYVPLTRVIDASHLPPSRRARQLEERDRSDLPTLLVHDLLAPIVTLTSDPDLLNLNVGHSSRWRTVNAGTVTAGVSTGLYIGGGLAIATGYGLVQGIRRAAPVAKEPWFPLLAGAALLGLFLTRNRWRSHAADMRNRIGEGFQDILTMVRDVAAEAEEAQRWLEASQSGIAGASVVHQTARALAPAPAMTRSQISQLLHPSEPRAIQDQFRKDLGSLMSNCTAFFEPHHNWWQVGRAGIDFGIQANGGHLAVATAARS